MQNAFGCPQILEILENLRHWEPTEFQDKIQTVSCRFEIQRFSNQTNWNQFSQHFKSINFKVDNKNPHDKPL